MIVQIEDAARGAQLSEFDELRRRYRGDVMRFAKAIERTNVEKRIDLEQETWIKIWRFLSKWDRNKPFLPWALRVMQRTQYDRHRADLSRVQADSYDNWEQRMGVPFEVSDELDVEAECLSNMQVETILKEARGFSDDYLAVFTGVCVQERDPNEVAAELGVNTCTVRSRLFRARKMLASRLESNPEFSRS